MHNKHYIIISAETKDEAQRKVELELENFGNENNWSQVEEILEVGNAEDKDKLQEVINKINKMTGEETINIVEKNIEALEVMVGIDKNTKGSTNPFNYYTLSQYYKDLYELTSCKGKTLNTEADIETCGEYYGWEFTEYGVTNMVCNKEENDKIYVVKIDMHS